LLALIVVPILGAEFLARVLAQCVLRIALVFSQDIQPVLLRLTADAEVIVYGVSQVLLSILQLNQELVVVTAGYLVQLVQADEELGGERSKANLVVGPLAIEVLAAVVPVDHHGPAATPHLLVAEHEEGLHIRPGSDADHPVLLLQAVLRSAGHTHCPAGGQELRLKVQAVGVERSGEYYLRSTGPCGMYPQSRAQGVGRGGEGHRRRTARPPQVHQLLL